MDFKDKILSILNRINKPKVISALLNFAVTGIMTGCNCPPETTAAVTGAISACSEILFTSKTENDKNERFKELTKALKNSLDDSEFELPYYCKTLLYSELFDQGNWELPEILGSQEPFTNLKDKLIEICRKDKACDLNTMPLDKIVNMIIKECYDEINENPDMHSYLIDCRRHSELFPLDLSKAFEENKQYEKSFSEPMFLHKDDYYSPVNLKNLFVEPEFKVIHGNNDDSKLGFEKLLKKFLEDNETRFLFIEGDAGCGKTTLAAWMNFQYINKEKFAENVFGGRTLLTVRLRDLDENILRNNSFSAAVRSYLGIGSLSDFKIRFPNALLLLDGFDELCMIEEMNSDHIDQLRPFSEEELENFKIIITSRTQYIKPTDEMKYGSVSLLHFDKEQREKWIENYTSPDRCNQSIDPKIRDYILNIDDNKTSCICDTPMTLYMLAAKEGAADYLKNDWSLYHHIFYSTLNKTVYNKKDSNTDFNYEHAIEPLKDVLYRIGEEIAYEMYKKGNSNFYLLDEQLSGIIEKLSKEQQYKELHLEESTTQEIVRHCYALCNYWKANEDRGVAEFLHNNIRDFFFAEKICRELDAAVKAKTSENESRCRIISRKLCDLFSYGSLETNVMYFIYSRAEYNKENVVEDFAKYEYKNCMIADIISDMSEGNVLAKSLVNTTSAFNPIQCIANIVKCTVQVYRMAYEPYLRKDEYIKWLSEKNPENNLLFTLFDKIFPHDNTPELQNGRIGLGSRNNFSKVAFKINLSYMNLKFADFSGAVFYGANLISANLYFAKLSGAKLIRVNLREANLIGANLFEADFLDSNLCHANFRYANLRGANFCGANLSRANLREADLRGVNLRGAILPDGFRSYNRDSEDNQDEQIEHLKSLNIPGLKI